MRAEGILSFGSGDRFGLGRERTDLGLGGRLLWVMHQSSSADFSLGGGLGVLHIDVDGDDDSVTDFHLEAVAQLRAFIVENVALSTSFGFGVNLQDRRDDSFGFGGLLLGNAGLIYFFQ
jgi:hypothetical protein